MGLPSATFGPSETLVSRVGLGGEGVLRTTGREAEARAVTTVIVGCGDPPSQVRELARAGQMGPLPPEEPKHLKEPYRPQARRLAF